MSEPSESIQYASHLISLEVAHERAIIATMRAAPPLGIAPDGARYGIRLGDRLRVLQGEALTGVLADVASAIDKDGAVLSDYAEELEGKVAALEADLAELEASAVRWRAGESARIARETRILIREAVDGLLYSIDCENTDPDRLHKNVVDVEPLLARLDEALSSDVAEDLPPLSTPPPGAAFYDIAGAPGTKGLRVGFDPDGTIRLRPLDPAVSAGFAIGPEAASGLLGLLMAHAPSSDYFALADDGADS
jgi:hypothetical protein